MPVFVFICLIGTYKNSSSNLCSLVNDINRTLLYNRTFYPHPKWWTKSAVF